MLEQLQKSAVPAALWQGNNGFILYDGKRMIATDLDLTLSERIFPPTVNLDELAQKLDLLLITHGHEDHFSAATVKHLLRGTRCRFVIPESCREKALAIEGLAPRAVFAKPGDVLEVSGVRVECIRALHGHIGGTVYSGASMLDCGYRFFFGGQWFYQPGDTVLLEEHLDMRADVLFVSPTEHNMGVENAVRLIRMIQPETVILQHHSTYHENAENRFWTHGYVTEVLEALSAEERKRCVVPEQNRVIVPSFEFEQKRQI